MMMKKKRGRNTFRNLKGSKDFGDKDLSLPKIKVVQVL